jgi:hypothetical protein
VVYVGGQDKRGELTGSLEPRAEENAQEQGACSSDAGKTTMAVRCRMCQTPQIDPPEQDQKPRRIRSNASRKQTAYSYGQQSDQEAMPKGEENAIPSGGPKPGQPVEGSKMVGINAVTQSQGKSEGKKRRVCHLVLFSSSR